MKTKFEKQLSDRQFKTMRMVMVSTKGEEGFLGIKFAFSTAVFLFLCVAFFPLAIVWFIFCTMMALNERSNRAQIRAANQISREMRRDREAKMASVSPSPRKMRPCDYYN